MNVDRFAPDTWHFIFTIVFGYGLHGAASIDFSQKGFGLIGWQSELICICLDKDITQLTNKLDTNGLLEQPRTQSSLISS